MGCAVVLSRSGRSGRVLKLWKKDADPNAMPRWEYVRLNMCVYCGQAEKSRLSHQHSLDISAIQALDSDSDSNGDEDAIPCGQYSFSVRVFPGQSLSEVEVGWVTAGFRSPALPAMNGYRCAERRASLRRSDSAVRQTLSENDKDSFPTEQLELKVRESYTCKLSSLCSCTDRPMSRELMIDCILNTNQCTASFRVNGRRGLSLQPMKVQQIVWEIR